MRTVNKPTMLWSTSRLFNLTPKVHSYSVLRNRLVLKTPDETGDGWLPVRRGVKTDVKVIKAADGALLTLTEPTNKKKRGGTIVYAHGNGHDLGWIYREGIPLKLANCTGCTVVAFEYPGYGPGKPEEVDLAKAIRWAIVAYDYAQSLGEGAPALYGYSLGGGIAAECARVLCADPARVNPRALFLEATFRSPLHTLTPKGDETPTSWKIMRAVGQNTLRTHAFVGKLPLPVYYAHGTADQRCPFDGARRMAEESPNTAGALWAEGHTHGNVTKHPRYCRFVGSKLGVA